MPFFFLNPIFCFVLTFTPDFFAGCLLTVILLMRALDPLKLEAEMLGCFTTILSQDTYRANYFKDLRSKFIMENAIMRYLQESSKVTESQVKQATFDASGKVSVYE